MKIIEMFGRKNTVPDSQANCWREKTISAKKMFKNYMQNPEFIYNVAVKLTYQSFKRYVTEMDLKQHDETKKKVEASPYLSAEDKKMLLNYLELSLTSMKNKECTFCGSLIRRSVRVSDIYLEKNKKGLKAHDLALWFGLEKKIMEACTNGELKRLAKEEIKKITAGPETYAKIPKDEKKILKNILECSLKKENEVIVMVLNTIYEYYYLASAPQEERLKVIASVMKNLLS